MLLPANRDTNGVPTEASIDVTMTTPDATAPPTPAATTVTVEAGALPDATQPTRSLGSQAAVEDARTEATRQKVADIIDHQFDLEILLRHAESTAIAQELAKAERMLEDLRHAILSGRCNISGHNNNLSWPCFFSASTLCDQSYRQETTLISSLHPRHNRFYRDYSHRAARITLWQLDCLAHAWKLESAARIIPQ